MYLYHATYKKRIPSIKKLGLGGKQIKTWEFSESGVVYLAKDPYIAESYAECAENVAPGVYDSGIVILSISISLLDRKLLIRDNNIRDNTSDTIGYKGIIPSKFLYIWNENQMIPLMMARQIKARL